MNIRDRIRVETKGHSMYDVRKEQYKNNKEDTINFCISPTTFKLTKEQKKTIEDIGQAICDYMDCCIELYKENETVKELLDRGKPEHLKKVKDAQYLFLRPDLILTDKGFCVCEIETSPFGLGLAEVLNRSYGNEGFNTIIQQNQLNNYIQSNIPDSGTIAYTEKVKSFKGQMDFLAEQIFSGNSKRWDSKQVESGQINDKEIYRAFYLSEQMSNKEIAEFLKKSNIYLPTSTPQFEEKAILAFIWDKRFTETIRSRIGEGNYKLLRNIIPKTWIIGEEEYIDEKIAVNGVKESIDIANLGKSKRKFVIKQSGFTSASSWGEGVKFLHKKSAKETREIIQSAIDDKDHLYIIQEFEQAKNVPMSYIQEDNTYRNMNAKIRITPYYAYMGKDKGKMIAAKVTGCENTEYIHASTASINTAISYDER